MGWSEWPLMVFTVLAQSAVGAFWICSLAILSRAGGQSATARLEKLMIFIWIFSGIGFMFSSLHLGEPLRAMNAFIKVFSAPLSNEGFIGVLFLGCGGFAWLLAILNKAPGVRKILLILAFVLSLGLIWAMSCLYMMPTVPTWNNWTTPASFIVTAMVGGAALANFVLKTAGIDAVVAPKLNKMMVFMGLAGLVIAAIVTINVALILPEINSSVKSASALSPEMGMLQMWRFILMALGLSVVFYQLVSKGKAASLALLGVCGVVAAEFIGRGVFYGLHMTVGMV